MRSLAIGLLAILAGAGACGGDPEPAPTPSSALTTPSATPGQVAVLSQGPAATAGFFYAIELSGFPADTDVTVTCHDSVDAQGFITFTLRTDASGKAAATDRCYSGDGPEHWFTANGVQSNRMTWSAQPSAKPSTSLAKVALTRGSTAEHGYFYVVALTGFPARADVTVVCRDSVDPQGFLTFTLRADASGKATATDKCYSGDGPQHWVTANGIESNRVAWTRNDAAITVAKGSAATAGFFYVIQLKKFRANRDIQVTCHDSVDPQGFITFTLHTDASGNVSASDRCYSGDGPEHWVSADHVESNRVTW